MGPLYVMFSMFMAMTIFAYITVADATVEIEGWRLLLIFSLFPGIFVFADILNWARRRKSQRVE